MNRLKLIAEGKKQKWKKLKQEEYYSDTDEELTSDDEDSVSQGMIGQWYNKKYIVLKYLGRGTFSRVWLVLNIEDEKYYAMKVLFTEFYEDSKHELKVTKYLDNKENENSRLIKTYDSFYVEKELCLVTELLGMCLLDLLKTYIEEDPPLKLIKYITREILKGLVEIHSKKLIHTDLKEENVMTNLYPKKLTEYIEKLRGLNIKNTYETVLESEYPEDIKSLGTLKKKKVKRKCKIRAQKKITQWLEKHLLVPCKIEEKNGLEIKEMEDIELDIEKIDNNDNIDIDIDNLDKLIIKVIDFGNAEYIDKKLQDIIQIQMYRPPENIINDYYDCKSDIWTLGCIVFSMLTGDTLFDIDIDGDDIDKDREHLHQMYEILGKMPRDMTQDCDFSEDLFDSKGRILKNRNCEYTSIKQVLINEYEFIEKEADEASEFLKLLLEYDPKKRISAQDCLEHSWLNI